MDPGGGLVMDMQGYHVRTLGDQQFNRYGDSGIASSLRPSMEVNSKFILHTNSVWVSYF